MTGVRLGRDAVLYLNTAVSSTFSSPSWSAVPNVSDLMVSAAWEEADASTRETKVKMSAKTLLPLEVTGKLKFDLTDTNTGTIMDAMVATTVLDFLVLNGSSSTNGARGYRFEGQVFQANEDQGLGTAIFEDFKIKPFPNGNAPQSAKVTTGAPVLTSM